MSGTAQLALPKMNANKAAVLANCTAAAPAELPAAFVSFQRQQPGFPPTQNVDSATCSLTSARQFGGKNAICAIDAVTITTLVTFT